MPFGCCKRGKHILQPEVIELKNAEITELQEQVNEKQKEINRLFAANESYKLQLDEAKAETEKIRRGTTQSTVKDADVQKYEKTIKTLEEQLQVKTKQIEKLQEQLKQVKREDIDEGPSLQAKTKLIETLQERIRALERNQPRDTDENEPSLQGGSKTTKKSKRLGIIVKKSSDDPNAKKTHKDEEDRQFLLKAIQSNDLLRRLKNEQITQIIDYMVKVEYPKGHTVIKEGDEGDRFYILQKGKCNVLKGSKIVSTINEGTGFGEIAIVYGGKRTATIVAAENVEAWYLMRSTFKKFTREAVENRDEQVMELMKSCVKLGITDRFNLIKIAQVVNEEEFNSGEYIVRQGEIGKIFYIIKSGEVDVTQNNPSASNEKAETWIRTMKDGDYFGEGALREKDNRRGANVIAKTENVVCFTLDEENFNQLIGQAARPVWREIDEPEMEEKRAPRASMIEITLKDFTFLSILGSGGFGRVELVRRRGTDETYALKCMKKSHIVETRQQDHVYSEKKIMLRCRSQFIVQLYKTFKNNKYVYMLMEPCLGGELWKHLRDAIQFSDNRTKFYTACVVEALSYLHRRGILYRDLKPENLLLDKRGYVKIVDFGFAKTLDPGERTWTFCGTPQYVPPEIILNQGHDMSVDYWALGILIFEFLTGNPPFDSVDQMKTYRMILRGIDAIDFPVSVKKPAQNLIRRLCKDQPSQRLGNLKNGINDIQGHRWFSGFDWEGLRSGKLKAEFVPIVNNSEDTSNFDQFQRRMSHEKVPSEMSGWDRDF